MREIVFDTETTGLDPSEGHWIVEIGAVELIAGRPRGAIWHSYFNPGRDVPSAAAAIHGLTDQKLASEPVFKDKALDFLEFVGGDRLVAHNAAFDLRFLNAELLRCGQRPFAPARCIDTLELARKLLPGKAHTLDALCKRFGVSNSSRTFHGAPIDARLLADVYAHLTGRAQLTLELGPSAATANLSSLFLKRLPPLPTRLTEEERAAHAKLVESLGPDAIWLGHKTSHITCGKRAVRR